MKIWTLWAGIALLLSCSDGSGPNPGTCPQTSEFGNFGCARVEGVVRDASGAPLANATVTLTPAEGVSNTFDTAMDHTDAAGRYSVEIHDLGGEGVHPPADPVAMNLRATLLNGENPPPASDLVPVSVKFAPVGQTPEVTPAPDISIQVSS